MDFEQVAQYPPFYQLGMGIVFAIVLVIGLYLKLGNRANAQGVRITDLERTYQERLVALEKKYTQQLDDKDIVWQTRLEDALQERDRQHAENLKRNNEALQADFSKQLEAIQRAQEELDRKREDAHTQRLQVITDNFARLQSSQTSALDKNSEALRTEIALREEAQAENDLLKSTLDKLNTRIDGLEAQLKDAQAEIKRLHKSNSEHEEQEDSLKKIIKGLKDEIELLRHQNELLRSENEGIVKMATAYHLKLSQPEDKQDGI